MIRKKQGNKWVLEGLCVDADGDTITNLSTATAIKFQLKTTRDGTAVVEETESGGGIVADSPSTGYLTITVLPAKTVLLTDPKYYMAIQVEWAGNNIQEAFLEDEDGKEFEMIEVVPQIIANS